MGSLFSAVENSAIAIVKTSDQSRLYARSMSALLFDKYEYARQIVITRELWDKFKDFHGKPDYYFFGGGLKHGGICFRRNDTGECGRIELVHSMFERRRKWYTLAKRSAWRPEPDSTIHTATHSWSAPTILQRCHDFASLFSVYHALFHNCNLWKVEVAKHMQNKGPEVVPQVTTLDELWQYADQLRLLLEVKNEAQIEPIRANSSANRGDDEAEEDDHRRA